MDQVDASEGSKLATNLLLAGIVAEKLHRRWSPQQIAGWLKLTSPDDPGMHVSHESIYRTAVRAVAWRVAQTRGGTSQEARDQVPPAR